MCSRAHSSVVEQFPLKEKVDGSNPSGLTINQEAISLEVVIRIFKIFTRP